MAKLAIVEETRIRLLSEEPFLNEQELEALLEANPELIALDEIDAAAAPLIPIGRQVTLAGQALDLLFIDQSGKLTAVEAKLERNAEIRRQVIAQVLEYGAYLSEWNLDDLEQQAGRYLSDPKTPERFRGGSLFDSLARSRAAAPGEDGLQPEQLRTRVAEMLESSSFRLIVAVDRIVDPLRRLVQFLNRTTNFELYLLEVQQYRTEDGIKLASAGLFGRNSTTTVRPPSPPVWAESRFIEALKSQAGVAAGVGLSLYGFIQEAADTVVWGSGAVEGAVGYGVRVGGARLVLFYATTKGKVWVSMGPLNKALGRSERASFLATLRGLGVDAPGDYLSGDRALNFDAGLLGETGAFDKFKAAILVLQGAGG